MSVHLSILIGLGASSAILGAPVFIAITALIYQKTDAYRLVAAKSSSNHLFDRGTNPFSYNLNPYFINRLKI